MSYKYQPALVGSIKINVNALPTEFIQPKIYKLVKQDGEYDVGEYVYHFENGVWEKLDQGNATWSSLADKPFETVSGTFSTDNAELEIANGAITGEKIASGTITSDNLAETYTTRAYVDEALHNKADKSEVLSDLELKADKSTTYTKTDVDDKLDTKADISEVNSALSLKADKSTTYTKTEVDNKVSAKQDKLVSGTNIKTVNNNSLLGSGNVTISAEVAEGSITTDKLANGAVTASKLAETYSTKTYVDNQLSSKQNTLVSGTNIKTVNNNSLLGSGNVTISAEVPDGSITAAKLASTAVTTAKIASSAVTNAKIATNAVNTAELVNSSVTNAKLADGAVTTAKIGSGAITSAKMASGAVTGSAIADNTITGSKLADSTVTGGKIAKYAVGKDNIADFAINNDKIALDSIDGRTMKIEANSYSYSAGLIDKMDGRCYTIADHITIGTWDFHIPSGHSFTKDTWYTVFTVSGHLPVVETALAAATKFNPRVKILENGEVQMAVAEDLTINIGWTIRASGVWYTN